MKRWTALGSVALFIVIMSTSDLARAGAMDGLRLWSTTLVPALFPAFVAVGLLQSTGAAAMIARSLAPAAERLPGLSGAAAVVFLTGLSGGYPLGACALAQAVQTGQLSREEAGELYGFCDNTGPAFAVCMVGQGVLGDARWGWLLWGIHVFSAVILARVFSRDGEAKAQSIYITHDASFGRAFTQAVSGAVTGVLSVGGFVVFFSSLPVGELLSLLRMPEIRSCLVRGMLELSSGVGALSGSPLSPATLALCGFLLSFGGLCVHMQSVAVTEAAGIDSRKRLRGKLLQGVLSGVMAYMAGAILL